MSIKDRLIQFVLGGKDELSPVANKAAAAVEELSSKASELGAALDSAKEAQGLAKALEFAQRDAEQAKKNLSQTESQVSALREALNKAPGSAGLQQSLKEAEREANKARRQLNALETQLEESERAARAAGIDVDKLGAEHARLKQEVERARQAVKDNADALKEAERASAAAGRAAAEHASRLESVKVGVVEATTNFGKWLVSIYLVDKALQGLAAGFGYIKDGLNAVVAGGNDSEEALAQLEAAIKSTGGAAGYTAEQLVEMADGFEKSSRLTSEQVQAGMARLLAYTDVIGDEFPRAMQIAVDQQQRLGVSIEQSAETVGKALQSPAEAMAALGRQGFKLDATQKALLTRMVATGKTAEAQAIIMDMMAEAYGGAAAAAKYKTFGGLMKTLGDQIGNFAEQVGNSGAFDYIRGKVQELIDTIDEMASDGRLDAMAQSLSDLFTNSAKSVEKYILSLKEIDVEALAASVASTAANIERTVASVVGGVQAMTATMRTVWNAFSIGINSAMAVLAFSIGKMGKAVLKVWAEIAGAIGKGDLKKKAEELMVSLDGLTKGWAANVKEDVGDIQDAWSGLGDTWKKMGEKLGEALTKNANKLAETKKAAQDAAEAFEAAHFRINDLDFGLFSVKIAETEKQLNLVRSAAQAALSRGDIDKDGLAQILAEAATRSEELRIATEKGTQATNKQSAAVAELIAQRKALVDQQLQSKGPLDEFQKKYDELTEKINQLSVGVDGAAVSIKSYADAQAAFNTAGSVAELKAFQKALFEAYSSKETDISLERFQQLHNDASQSIKQLEIAAGKTAPAVNSLAKEMKSLAAVQADISSAKTVDELDAARDALTKLKDMGRITADEYLDGLTKARARQQELTDSIQQTGNAGREAGDKLAKSVQMYNDALEDGILTSEELRRVSGQRMEEERKASGEAMEARRKGSSETKKDMSAFSDFFGGVMSAAQQPLAAMSNAALEAFQRLRGISTASPEIDTSSLESTRRSLAGVSDALARVTAAQQGLVTSSITKWQLETQAASLKTQAGYLGQKAALQSLIESYESGALSARKFIASASAARRGMGLLDDSDLSQLDSAIESAKQQMEQLRESSQSTLDSIQDELDQLEGRQADIDRRRFKSRQQELQSQFAEAQGAGDAQAMANLQKAMSTLRQVEAVTEQNRQAEEQKARQEAVAAAAPTPAATPAATPAKVIRLESKGKSVDVTVNSDRDETGLLSILEDYGMRSL
ncbi:phage tail length tape measure family protein [Pseudomonas sp. LRF_L74]|uniref:phage tail length tape measure family protein n=1 Tax=Pseudomonas sp. LRF_L74 TaxID=3369422 RepID=UPI003F5EC335